MKKILILAAIVTILSGCQTNQVKPDNQQPDHESFVGKNHTPYDNTKKTKKSHANLKEAAAYNLSLGIGYIEQGRYDVAQKRLLKAIRQDSTLAPAYGMLAIIYQRTDFLKEARQAYKNALRYGPEDPITQTNYAWYLCKFDNNKKEAYKYFEKAINNRATPDKSAPMARAGACAENHNDNEKARKYFENALDVNERNSTALIKMAEIYFDEEKYELASIMIDSYHRYTKPSAYSLFIGVKISRKAGNRDSEGTYETLLKNNFPSSKETRELFK